MSSLVILSLDLEMQRGAQSLADDWFFVTIRNGIPQ